MNPELALACNNYSRYVQKILSPAATSFNARLSRNELDLHHVFGINLFLAHAVDYIQAVRRASGISESRAQLVRTFDERFGVDGGRFRSKKFELIDAVNNALKHIQLDDARYAALIESYGEISFNCLVPDQGRVLCVLAGHRFDYARVILRPAIRALAEWVFEDSADVLDFARGDATTIASPAAWADESDPIDQMIMYCNPGCEDCGEPESDCLCGTFVYDGSSGKFAPDFDATFDIDSVMAQISGAYRKDD